MKTKSAWDTLLAKLSKVGKKTVKHTDKLFVQRLDRLKQAKRPIVGWMLLATIILMLSVAQWLSLRGSLMTQSSSGGESFSEGVLGPLESLNPLFAKSSAEESTAKLLFASLYQYDGTGHLKSDLASEIQVNDTETEYTVTLKDNLKWSDGAYLTVDDVLFTVSLLRDPDTKSDIVGWRSVNVEKLSDKSIKFILSSPYAPFQHALTFPVLPKHILSDVIPANLREHSFNMNPISSGPFKVQLVQNVSANSDKKIVHMEANQNYHRGRAKLDRFKLYIYPSKDDIQDGLAKSEIIATPELNSQTLPGDIMKKYVSDTFSINNGVFALFNMRSEKLVSQKVRKALSLAIDRDSLRRSLSQSGQSLSGPFVKGLIDEQLVEADSADIEKAKSLLDDEGWLMANGVRSIGGTPVSLAVVAMKDPEYEEVAKKIIDIWQNELGIKAELRVVDPSDISQNVLQAVLRPRDFDVLIYELALGGDPDVYAYWHSSQATADGLNFSNYSNVVADDALASGRSVISRKLRNDRYVAFVKRWQSDVPAIPLYQPEIEYIRLNSASALTDGSVLISPADRYANVIYWTVERSSVYKTP